MNASVLLGICAAALLFSASESLASGRLFLIPGSGSSGDQIELQNLGWALSVLGKRYFGHFQEEFNKAGVPSTVCPRTPDGDRRSLEERAEECVSQILGTQQPSAVPGRDVILVGHSMGGLVARLVAADTRVGSRIRAVVTLSTPHRGTPLADFAIAHHEQNSFFDPYRWVVDAIGFTPEHLRYLTELRVDRGAAAPEVFGAQDIEDNPDVSYFSITNSKSFIPNPALEVSRRIIGVPNDGIVPEASMVHGYFWGHLNADHWSSACVDPVVFTPECAEAVRFLVPRVRSLLAEIHR